MESEHAILPALAGISARLAEATDVEAALGDVLAVLVQVSGAQAAWLLLPDPARRDERGSQGFRLAAQAGLSKEILENLSLWSDICTCQNLYSDGLLEGRGAPVQCSRFSGLAASLPGLAIHFSLPLHSAGRRIGILNLAARSEAIFTQTVREVLQVIGAETALALERARLVALLQAQYIDEQNTLLTLSSELLQRTDFDDLIHYLVSTVPRLLQVDACALLEPDARTGDFRVVVSSGWHTDPAEQGWELSASLPSDVSLALKTREPVIVSDLQHRELGFEVPGWFLAEGFRGHVVIPLIAQGEQLGALVIDSRQALHVDESRMRLLHLLANQAAIAIQKARLVHTASIQHRLEGELAVGRQIQRSFLPQSDPEIPGWEFASHYYPTYQLGGDFYDFFLLPEGTGQPPTPFDQLGMVIADVADKGIPAALYMALSRTMIRSTALSGRTPGPALERASQLIMNDSQSDLFLSAFYALLHAPTGRLAYANAGHNPPLWWQSASDSIERLEAKGTILGAFADINLRERVIYVGEGDVLFFYTDGVPEAINTARQEFGQARIEAILRNYRYRTASEIANAIADGLREYIEGVSQMDDITFFVARRRPA